MRRLLRSCGLASFAVLVLSRLTTVSAQAPDGPADREGENVGQFITVDAPLADHVLAHVQQRALDVRNRHATAGRRPYIVFQIEPGLDDSYERCQELANFISQRLTQAQSVAYVPESLSGHRVMLALACDEIVLHEDAQIGDIGRSQAFIPQVQRDYYRALASDQHPRFEAIVEGMLDRAVRVLAVDFGQGQEYVLESDQRLNEAQRGAAEVIFEAGSPGVLSAEAAANMGLVEFVVGGGIQDPRLQVAEAYRLPPESLLEREGEWIPARIRIDGMIEPILEEFVKRSVRRAIAQGANFLIFEIESPGGFGFTGLEMASYIANLESREDLGNRRVHTVAYIPDHALSAAAFVALGCDEIVMHPGARLGDAGIVQETAEGGQFELADEKIVSDFSEQLRILARQNGYPESLAIAMVDQSLQVYRVENIQTGEVAFLSEGEIRERNREDGGVWQEQGLVEESREGRFLTVNGERAVELGLARTTVDNFEGLKQFYGLQGDIAPLGRTWVDTIVFLLNTTPATIALLVIGLIALYIELHLPGVGLGAIIAGLCFLLFFWSKVLGGTAGWLEVMLFLGGIACLAMEIFVIPGFGVFGVSGILLILGSIVLASQTFVIPRTGAESSVLHQTLGTIALAILVFTVAAVLLGRYLPSIPLFGRIVLGPDESVAVEPGPEAARSELIGRRGQTMSVLRPSGKVQIGDRVLDVVAEGNYIPAGTPIEIVEVAGNRIVVRPVPPS